MNYQKRSRRAFPNNILLDAAAEQVLRQIAVSLTIGKCYVLKMLDKTIEEKKTGQGKKTCTIQDQPCD
jgi:hypothetical protein